jgi:tetratricopeptide (TPR) repeat protein
MTARFVASLLCCAALLAGCNTAMKGVGSLRSGNYAEAVAEFQAQVAANPADWKAREMLGYAYLKGGDAQKAIPEFEKALSLEPKASMCHVYLGWAQLKLDNQTGALEAWRTFNDPTKPLVKQEVDRLITLVEIEQSKKLAREALAAETQRSVAVTRDNSYAVFNFAVSGSGADMVPLQKALTAMTISDLAQIKGISVIERTRMQALLDELRLGASGAVDPATAPKAGRLLGAEKLVVGSLSDNAGKLGIASSVASTKQTALVGSFGLSEEKSRFFDLQKQMLARIVEVNKIALDPEQGRTLLSHYHTRSYEATVSYGLGLDSLDKQDWLAAQEHFAQAAKLDPFFMLARIARDHVPVGITIRVGQQSSADAVGNRIEAAATAQGVSPTSTAPHVVTPGSLPATTPPPVVRPPKHGC